MRDSLIAISAATVRQEVGKCELTSHQLGLALTTPVFLTYRETSPDVSDVIVTYGYVITEIINVICLDSSSWCIGCCDECSLDAARTTQVASLKLSVPP